MYIFTLTQLLDALRANIKFTKRRCCQSTLASDCTYCKFNVTSDSLSEPEKPVAGANKKDLRFIEYSID